MGKRRKLPMRENLALEKEDARTLFNTKGLAWEGSDHLQHRNVEKDLKCFALKTWKARILD